MFADHSVPLDLDYRDTRASFLRLVHGDWLDDLSRGAYADGLADEVRVGPFGGVPGMSKLVRVSLLEPVAEDDLREQAAGDGEVLVPVRWEATGRMGRLFPVLDANLILGPDDRGRAVLRITGVYRPPLGGLGEALDQAVLRRVATATMKSLLRRIADLLGAEAVAQDSPARGLAPRNVAPELP